MFYISNATETAITSPSTSQIAYVRPDAAQAALDCTKEMQEILCDTQNKLATDLDQTSLRENFRRLYFVVSRGNHEQRKQAFNILFKETSRVENIRERFRVFDFIEAFENGKLAFDAFINKLKIINQYSVDIIKKFASGSPMSLKDSYGLPYEISTNRSLCGRNETLTVNVSYPITLFEHKDLENIPQTKTVYIKDTNVIKVTHPFNPFHRRSKPGAMSDKLRQECLSVKPLSWEVGPPMIK